MSDESIQKSSGEGLEGLRLFCNAFIHTLDAKKRVTIPSDWRELVGMPKRIFIMPGVESAEKKGPHLRALPAREADRRLEKFKQLSLSDTVAQERLRVLAVRSDMVPWDVQGRIRLRDDLLAHAGLGGRDKQVVLVGSLGGFEIWSTERWKEQEAWIKRADLAESVKFFNM